MNDINAIAAWTCIAAGVVSGMSSGLFFHDARWLGGYGTWPRRMLRLGHISFFGIGLLNLAYALTLHVIGWPAPPAGLSWALATAGVLMPGVCYLAAWRMPLRHLFALPVGCVLLAVGGLLWWRIQS